jgi:hypothetical protein
MLKVFIQNWQQDDKNCAMPLGRLNYLAIRHVCAQFQMHSFSSFCDDEILAKSRWWLATIMTLRRIMM